MTQPGIEPGPPGPLVNTLLIRPMAWLWITSLHWPSWLGLQNTPTASLQRGKISPMSVLDMILNLIVRLWRMQGTPLLPSLPGPLWP